VDLVNEWKYEEWRRINDSSRSEERVPMSFTGIRQSRWREDLESVDEEILDLLQWRHQ
jgi:hypothetical protein